MVDVYLDDERTAPEGWVQCRWPEEVIELLKAGDVNMLSLDHDLGECGTYAKPRTGYDVLLWIEREVATNGFKPPLIMIHTANPSAKDKMKAAARQIMKLYKAQP